MAEQKLYTVYTPNPGFCGVRNAGRFSTYFNKGKAECDKATAELLVMNFDYLCPELFPANEKTEAGGGRPEAGGGKNYSQLETEIVFTAEHKIGKNKFEAGDRKVFKRAYAQKLVFQGKAEFAEESSHSLPDAVKTGESD